MLLLKDFIANICDGKFYIVEVSRMAMQELKSRKSEERSLVRFFNLTKRMVALIWLDYHSNPVPYRILEPISFVDVDTYVSHPWIFLDMWTGNRLLGNKKKIYHPDCWSEVKKRLPQEYSHLIAGRMIVSITSPLCTLRDLTMQVVRDSIQTKEAISQLDVPLSIKSDLTALFIRKQSMAFIRNQFTSVES